MSERPYLQRPGDAIGDAIERKRRRAQSIFAILLLTLIGLSAIGVLLVDTGDPVTAEYAGAQKACAHFREVTDGEVDARVLLDTDFRRGLREVREGGKTAGPDVRRASGLAWKAAIDVDMRAYDQAVAELDQACGDAGF